MNLSTSCCRADQRIYISLAVDKTVYSKTAALFAEPAIFLWITCVRILVDFSICVTSVGKPPITFVKQDKKYYLHRQNYLQQTQFWTSRLDFSSYWERYWILGAARKLRNFLKMHTVVTIRISRLSVASLIFAQRYLLVRQLLVNKNIQKRVLQNTYLSISRNDEIKEEY